MKDYSVQNKKAWEYSAYEFWVRTLGTPAERAKKDVENPVGMLKRYSEYFIHMMESKSQIYVVHVGKRQSH